MVMVVAVVAAVLLVLVWLFLGRVFVSAKRAGRWKGLVSLCLASWRAANRKVPYDQDRGTSCVVVPTIWNIAEPAW